MRTRIVPITSGFLLVLFVFNTCVFGLFLSARLVLHHTEQRKSHHSEEEILTLRIDANLVEQSNDEFVWVKDWEFRYHGEMYDLEGSSKEGNVWIFHCKHDAKEDILRKQIDRANKYGDHQRDDRSKKNVKVNKEYFAHSSNFVNTPSTELRNIPAYLPPICTIYRAVSDPPPWVG